MKIFSIVTAGCKPVAGMPGFILDIRPHLYEELRPHVNEFEMALGNLQGKEWLPGAVQEGAWP